MAQGEWSKPNKYPMSRSNPPICLELNGKRIFAKGTNMPTPEIFPGIVTKERYQQMLTLVKNANMNIVRMWGGCGIQKNVYYNLCDEMGIMVWQEFPLACNHYGAYDCDHYCRVLNEEAKSIIKRLRNNVSLVLWCGGTL
jgi:beta-mannosidase